MAMFDTLLLKSPWTWATVLTLAIAEWGLLGWFQGNLSPPVLGVLLGAGLLSLALWPPLYKRSDLYLTAVAAQKERKRLEQAQRFENHLLALGQERAARQIQYLTERLQDLSDVMALRFRPHELTFQRYQGVATQVYAGAMRNLEGVLAAANSIQSIDRQHLKEQLENLKLEQRLDSREAKAVEDRLRLLTEQEDRIMRLLEQNEEALTALTEAATSLAAVDTAAPNTAAISEVIENLRKLAARAEAYGERI